MVTVGQNLNGFRVLSIISNGRRAIVSCRCGGTHVVGTEALQSGIACAAAPLLPNMREALRAEAERENWRRTHRRHGRPRA
jgi:hypothetical protein